MQGRRQIEIEHGKGGRIPSELGGYIGTKATIHASKIRYYFKTTPQHFVTTLIIIFNYKAYNKGFAQYIFHMSQYFSLVRERSNSSPTVDVFVVRTWSVQVLKQFIIIILKVLCQYQGYVTKGKIQDWLLFL